jgi:phosphoribosylanthranilate isomerase
LLNIIIQIYEIQTPREAEALIEFGVDHIGSVILSEDQWRAPGIRDTVRVVQQSGAKSSLIPLFSNPTTVQNVLDYYRPDILHFCESLTQPTSLGALVDLQHHIKARYPEIELMRSIPVARTGRAADVPTVELARQFEPVSDLFLTDTLLLHPTGQPTVSQPVSGFVGITGQTCDWNMAQRLVQTSQIPVILAGGLSPDNVAEAISRVRPAGVDSCTLTNARDILDRPIRFQKDAEKVKAFVDQVRQAKAALNADRSNS